MSSPAFGTSSAGKLNAFAGGNSVSPEAELDSAFACTSPTPAPDALRTVLLVPGLAADATQTFGWNYIPQLSRAGFDVCWIAPPHSGRGDLTQTAYYVSEGIRLAYQRLGIEHRGARA